MINNYAGINLLVYRILLLPIDLHRPLLLMIFMFWFVWTPDSGSLYCEILV